MRIHVKPHKLAETERLLYLAAGCKINTLPGGGYAFDRAMRNPRKGTMIFTSSEGYRRRIQAVKAAVRRFGREIVAVRKLAQGIAIEDCSLSYTQRGYKARFGDQIISVFDNSARGEQVNFKANLPWDRHTPDEAKLLSAHYMLIYRRDLLPHGTWLDPLDEAITALSNGGRDPFDKTPTSATSPQ